MRRYRAVPEPADAVGLVAADDGERVSVAADGYEGELGAAVDALRPGYLVSAALDWQTETARFADLTVESRTVFAYCDGVTNVFEEALDAWEEARREGLGMNGRVTYDTGREPNGVLYVVAAQRGERDVYEELRTGAMPLDPLLEKVDAPAPYEVFVLRPATHPFVLVYIVLEKGGILADTVRDTYDCPRPGGEGDVTPRN